MPYTKKQLLSDIESLFTSDATSAKSRVSEALAASVVEGDGLLKLYEENLPLQAIKVLCSFSKQPEFKKAKTSAQITKRRDGATQITGRFLQAACLAPDASLVTMLDTIIKLGNDATTNQSLQGVTGLNDIKNNVQQLVLLSLVGGFFGNIPLPERAHIMEAIDKRRMQKMLISESDTPQY